MGVLVGFGIGPLAQRGLDEALGLAGGPRGVGPGAGMFEAEALAEPAEGEGLIAGAVVGHDALDLDAEAFVVGESCLEEGGGAASPLAVHHLGKGDARSIVDGDVDELPARSFAARAQIALSFAVAGNAMADAIDPAELFDVEMDHLARPLAFVATRRLGRLQSLDPVEPQTLQNAADGGGRQRELAGDLLAGITLTAQ